MVAGEEGDHMAGWRGGIWWAGEEGDHMVGWGGGIPEAGEEGYNGLGRREDSLDLTLIIR